MDEADKKDNFWSLFQNEKSRGFTFWVVVFTIVFLAIGLLIINKQCWGLGSNNFGQLGDYFNGIAAPVLSLITIILLYNSFLVQKEELKATREALEQSAKEMQNSSTVMERMEQNAKLERLVSIVFKLLDKYENSRDKFTVYSETAQFIDHKGIDALKHVKDIYLKPNINQSSLRVRQLIDEVVYTYITGTKEQKIDKCLKYIFEDLKGKKFYVELKSLIYKFIAIYKCVLISKIPAKQLDDLRFAINIYLTSEEMFFVKLFINQLDDLSNLRTELEPFGIVSTSEAIYEQHVTDEINKINHG
ncbi:MAG: hypothetical protein ACO1PI_06630 [Bacteroidota bacterium]